MRLCIQVDLSRPLLAIFAIKDHHYTMEYKCLNFLCLSCGKYGHYVKNYQDSIHVEHDKANNKDIRHNEAEGGILNLSLRLSKKVCGCSCKKTRRRKINNTMAILNTGLKKGMKETSKSKGSRSSALLEEWEDGNMDTTVRQERKEDPSDKDNISSCKDK